MIEFQRQYVNPWPDYELLDAGGGKKLERFGNVVTIRPELQAYFKSGLPFIEWDNLADASFIENEGRAGNWHFHTDNIDSEWKLKINTLEVKLEFTKFKHLGIFPEQIQNWNYIRKILRSDDEFLNLFAYTGIASLFARSTGAKVTHIDSVKQLISWSKENMKLSYLDGIRWIAEDALKFAQKEVARGKKYKGIVMDPPAFGLGSKGEKWILEQKLPLLLHAANELLEENGFLLVNTYSPKLSPEILFEMASTCLQGRTFKINELWMKSKTGKDLYFGNVLKISAK